MSSRVYGHLGYSQINRQQAHAERSAARALHIKLTALLALIVAFTAAAVYGWIAFALAFLAWWGVQ